MGYASALDVALVVIAALIVPAVAIRRLMPVLEAGALQTANYRGRRMTAALGLVWPIWALGLLGVQGILEGVDAAGVGRGSVFERIITSPLAMPFFALPFILVVGAFTFGFVDDAFGAGGPKGFRGHLSALREGRLTTGMLKVLGIGGIALFYGASAARGAIERSGLELPAGGSSPSAYVAAWILAAAVIALSANLVNLLDLRPGRALKAYSAAVVVPAVLAARQAVASYNDSVAAFAGDMSGLAFTPADETVVVIATLIALLGPVVAVWHLDLRERGMLGDGGANVMGAVVGYLLTSVLSFTGLAVATAVLLALNLASERVSFSRVIDATPPLRWLDGMGRMRDD